MSFSSWQRNKRAPGYSRRIHLSAHLFIRLEYPTTINMEDIKSQCKKVWKSLTDSESKLIVRRTENLLLDVGTGGVIFWSGCTLGQAAQYALNISSATPLISTQMGALTIFLSSVYAVKYAAAPRQLLSSSSSSTDGHSPSYSVAQSIACGITGLVVFRLLGGKLQSIAPSDFRNLGAFSTTKGSLPATLEYADTGNRAVINAFGRLFGCHTCGNQSSKVSYHADHQPPVKFVKDANKSLLRKMMGVKIQQRFYPQCEPCSNIQGRVVKGNHKKLKMHASRTRKYHTTGAWLVFLFSSGLILPFMSTKTETDTQVLNLVTKKALNSMHDPILFVLDEQKEKLQRQLKVSKTYEEKQKIHDKLKQLKQQRQEMLQVMSK